MSRAAGIAFLLAFSPLVAAEGSSLLTVTPISSGTISAPRGAQRIEMLRLELQADCSADIPVEEVHLHRRGLGFSEDLAAIYIEADGVRVSRAKQPERGGTVDLTLRWVNVPACGTVHLRVLADIAATASVGGEHRIELASLEPIVAPGASVTIEPERGSTTTLLRTAGDTSGGISVEYLPLPSPVRYGPDRVIGRMRFTASGRYDQRLEQITLTNEGSARDADLKSLFFASNRGERVSWIAPTMRGERVTLSFAPGLLLRHGATKVLELHADAFASIRRTIRFVIQEESDVITRTIRRRSDR